MSTDTEVRYTPPQQAESITATVARLDERTFNLGQSMAKVETGMKDQDAKLDLLVADLNQRKGAGQQSKKTWATGAGLIAAAVGLTQLIEFLKSTGKH